MQTYVHKIVLHLFGSFNYSIEEFNSFGEVRKILISISQSVEGTPELSEADMVVFLGDFNYRLDGISYDEARDFVSQRCFDWLKERDQLRVEMEAGNVFQGMREAVIRFPPTYKFERHQAGLAGSFCSELYLFLDHVLVT